MTTAKSQNVRGFLWLDITKFSPAIGGIALVKLGMPSTASAGFEMDDPLAKGKRDRHIEYLIHNGKVWQTTWMDRTGSMAERGKKRYGVKELKGVPLCEFA